MKRAIILVHGYEKAEQNSFRDRLTGAIEYYTDGFQKEFEPDPVDVSGHGVRRFSATERRKDAPTLEIDVYEAYWADMIPTDVPPNPVRRVTRGFMLLAYWFFGGARRALMKPNYFGLGLGISGLLILLWYASLLMLAAKAIVADPTLTPGWLEAAVRAGQEEGATGLAAILGDIVSGIEELPWYGVFAAMLAGLPADKVAAVSEFAKAYLTDERAGEVPAGVRARTKKRLEALLDLVFAPDKGYDEIFVVGHSLGAAIAIDAIADYGDPRARTTFFTWGTPLRVFCAQEPQIDAECRKLLEADPPLADWIDVVIPNDWVAARVPGHAEAYGEKKSVRASSPKGWLAGWNASSHHDYYRSPEALLPLVRPAAGDAAAAPDGPDPSNADEVA